MSGDDPRLIRLTARDNIVVLGAPIHAGETVLLGGIQVEIAQTLGMGHKIASRAIGAHEDILKYGMPIGFAACDIAPGDHVHLHNLTSRYTPIEIMEPQQ